jgi:hypothetical protein
MYDAKVKRRNAEACLSMPMLQKDSECLSPDEMWPVEEGEQV